MAKSTASLLFAAALAGPLLVVTTAEAKKKAPPPAEASPKAPATVKDVLAASTVKGPAGTAALLKYLEAPAATVRKVAASRLGERGDVSADAALAKVAIKDKSAAVREAAKRARGQLRAASKAVKKKVVVEVPAAGALDDNIPLAATEQLTRLVRAAVKSDPRRAFVVKEKANKEPGYSLLLSIRSATDGKQGNVSLVEARCELTLLALPSRSLRLSSSASAAAGMEGDLSPAERDELLQDAVGACAPALAADFIDYVVARPSPKR